jgi:hypothetical protein
MDRVAIRLEWGVCGASAQISAQVINGYIDRLQRKNSVWQKGWNFGHIGEGDGGGIQSRKEVVLLI